MSFSSPTTTTTAVVETTGAATATAAAQQDDRLYAMYNRLVALNQRQGIGGTLPDGNGRATATMKAAPDPPAATTAPLTAAVPTSLDHRQHRRNPVHVTQSQTEDATTKPTVPAAAAAIDLLDDSDDDSLSVSDMDIDLEPGDSKAAATLAPMGGATTANNGAATAATTVGGGTLQSFVQQQHQELMAALGRVSGSMAMTAGLPNHHTLAAPRTSTLAASDATTTTHAAVAAALPNGATVASASRKRGLPQNSASTMVLHARHPHVAAASSIRSNAHARSNAPAPVASIDLCDDDDEDDVKMPARTMTPGTALWAAAATNTPVWDLTSAATTAATGVVAVDDDDDVVVEMNPSTFPLAPFAHSPSQRRARRRRRRLDAATTDHESSSAAVANPEFQVLTVFPDACLDHVRSRLAALNQSVAAVLLEMAESKSTYPKNEGQTTSATPSATDSVVVHMEQHAEASAVATSNNVDWMSMESFQPRHLYIEQAKHVLQGDFAFLSVKGATRCLAQYKFHYAVCHEKLLAAIKGDGSDTAATANTVVEDEGQNVQYDRILTMMRTRGAFLDKHQIARVLTVAGIVPTPIGAGSVVIQPYNDRDYAQVFLKNVRPKTATKKLVTDPLLVEEIKYVNAKMQKWLDAQQAARDLARQKQQAQKNGSAMECPCCCDSYPLEQMIQCRDEGHLFCHSCIVSYANNQIFGNDNLGVHKTTKKLSLELQCLQGDCPSYFERDFLKCALSARLLQHYDSIQIKLSIASAGLSDTVCACPKCDFCVEVPIGQNIVQCPVASCLFASCRECGEAAHIPLRYVVCSNTHNALKLGVFSLVAIVFLSIDATKWKRKMLPRGGYWSRRRYRRPRFANVPTARRRSSRVMDATRLRAAVEPRVATFGTFRLI
jgi:hypothetical protein